jgi:nitrate reductase gamma subunit
MSAILNAWPFVTAAYAVAIGGTVALLAWSLLAMRRAEARANALSRRRDD